MRLFVADSDRISVHRRRIVREDGTGNGRGSGIAQDYAAISPYVGCYTRAKQDDGQDQMATCRQWYGLMRLHCSPLNHGQYGLTAIIGVGCTDAQLEKTESWVIRHPW